MSLGNTKKTITDGLVVALDAANTKSFGGEETVNLCLFDNTTTFNTDYPSAMTQSVSTSFTYKGRPTTKVIANGTWNIYKYPYTNYTQTSGTTFTYSWKIKCANGSTPSFGNGYIYTIATSTYPTVYYYPIDDGWYQCYCTYNSTNSTMNLSGFTTGQTGVFYISDWQVEAKSYFTPYVYGTRGNTVVAGGGWRDITYTGNNGTLTNTPLAGSDYGGSLILSGTNQYVSISPVSNTIRTYDASIVFAVKLPAYSGGQRCILSYRGGTGGNLYIGKSGGGIFCYYNELNNAGYTVGSITDGAPVIVTILLNAAGSTLSTYINGSLAGSATRTGWVSAYNTVVNLGYDAGGTNEYMTGSFYYYAHYNRVLSDSEIQTTYKVLKDRLKL
jgi:hypothetical protein